MTKTETLNFIRESNRIEGIHRHPTKAEIEEFEHFLALKEVTVKDLERFVEVYAPGNRLRSRKGLNVRVGNHNPPEGGKLIKPGLENILMNMDILSPYKVHIQYELLHPFTDGNGRSGRALWAWQMNKSAKAWDRKAWLSLGFLHTYYYQSLDAAR